MFKLLKLLLSYDIINLSNKKDWRMDMATIVASFCNRFHEAMTIRELKPVELSERTGISLSTISQYMSGYSKPKTERTSLIADVLNVDPAWLMGFDVPMKRQVLDSSKITLYNVHCETEKEAEHMLSYRKLSEIGQKKVDSYTNGILELETAELEVNAAHERTDVEVTDDMRKNDDDIMDDENF